jgi:NAD(P)H-dependent FMN reductase
MTLVEQISAINALPVVSDASVFFVVFDGIDEASTFGGGGDGAGSGGGEHSAINASTTRSVTNSEAQQVAAAQQSATSEKDRNNTTSHSDLQHLLRWLEQFVDENIAANFRQHV